MIKHMIIATFFAAALSAATLTISPTSTTLPGGEVVTFQSASFSIASVPQFLALPIEFDATNWGAPPMHGQISLTADFDVNGSAGLLLITAYYDQPGGTGFRLSSPTWGSAKTADTELGWPLGIGAGSALAQTLVSGPLGSSATGAMTVRANIFTPEPSTFFGMALATALAARSLRFRKRSGLL